MSKKVTILLYFLFEIKGKYLDYAGGYGLFTRLMRDIGFDFYWYNPYTPNFLARGFEYNEKDSIEAITTFETFVNPINEIEKMLNISKNIIFTTELLPNPSPKPSEWRYYGLEHGLHIVFYNLKTLEFIANKYGLKFVTNGRIHMFADKNISLKVYSSLPKLTKLGIYRIINNKMNSQTQSDRIKTI